MEAFYGNDNFSTTCHTGNHKPNPSSTKLTSVVKCKSLMGNLATSAFFTVSLILADLHLDQILLFPSIKNV